MPNFLSNDESIQGKWGAPPKLDAPNIAGVLGEILQQRRWQQAQTQKALADTIKNVREERQSAQYLDAMKAAGLVPQDYDAGGFGGAKLGMDLATRIQHQNELAAREEHYRAMEARPTGRGSRGGGSGGDGGGSGDQTYPETIWDEQGREWRKGPGGRLIPMKPVGGTTAGGGKPTDLSKAVKERLELQDQFDILEKKRKAQEAADMTANRPANPFEKSDLYNLTKNRLKQLQDMPGMPSTEPAVTGDAESTTHPNVIVDSTTGQPLHPPSDKAGGHAENYGVQGVKMKAPDGTVKTVDPDHVDYYKAKGAVIVP